MSHKTWAEISTETNRLPNVNGMDFISTEICKYELWEIMTVDDRGPECYLVVVAWRTCDYLSYIK